MENTRIKFLQLNVGSLVLSERRLMLEDMVKRETPDVVLLSETHLKPSKYRGFRLRDFVIMREDEEQGVALLIRRGIDFERVDTGIQGAPLVCAKLTLMEGPGVTTMLVGSIYISSRVATEDLARVLDWLEGAADRFDIVAVRGDWNARYRRWGDLVANRNGGIIDRWMASSGEASGFRVVAPGTPTFPGGISVLDFYMLCPGFDDELIDPRECVTVPSFSDHEGVKLVLSLGAKDNVSTRKETELEIGQLGRIRGGVR